jgi:hypothetical protein
MEPTPLTRISMTPEEASLATGFSRTRIFNAIRDGEITARKDGKATVIETVELVRWVRSLPTRGRAPDAAAAAAYAPKHQMEPSRETKCPARWQAEPGKGNFNNEHCSAPATRLQPCCHPKTPNSRRLGGHPAQRRIAQECSCLS